MKHTKEILVALTSCAGTIAMYKSGLENWIIIVLVVTSIWAIVSLISWIKQIGKLEAEVNYCHLQIKEKGARIKELSEFERAYFDAKSRLKVQSENVSQNVSSTSDNSSTAMSSIKQDTSQ